MSQSESNPFQAPIQAEVEGKSEPLNLDFILLAKKWERYRLIYNGILVVETIALWLLLPLVGVLASADLAVVIIIGGIACNFFFLLGPAIDGYCQWIFESRSPAFGQTILLLGTGFTAILAAAALSLPLTDIPL